MTKPDRPTTESSDNQPHWSVYRQGDDGNQFVIKSGLTRQQADQLVEEFEARGHKQLYWVSQQDAGS